VRITDAAPIVLGSASPRRRELLALARVPFVVRAAGADESSLGSEPANAYLERVALAKLDAVRERLALDVRLDVRLDPPGPGRGGAILVADTIVLAPDGAVLGKPADDEEGRAMLERLAGATHTVRTRFLLAECNPDARIAHAQTVTTGVTFRPLARGEAIRYVASGEGRDKAGGYGVQGGAAAFVTRIEGSYTNVVGLPLCEVVMALRELGWFEA
jgi:septum formation protein